MKKIVLLSIICLALNYASAQEEAVLGHYLFNPVLINPGATGFDQTNHSIFMNIRSSYSSFPGAPRTYALSYNGAVGKRLGIGGMMYTENIASLTYYRGQLSFAFRYEANDLEMAAGFATQFNRVRIDDEDYLGNSIYDQDDEILAIYGDGERVFDASLGVYGSYKKNLIFGLSFPSLIRARLDEIEGQSSDGGLSHFTAFVGGDLAIDDYKIKLQPSILVKRLRAVPFQVDFNLLSSFLQDKLITGLKYTAGAGGNFGILLGTKYNAIRFIYSYDVYLGDFQQYNDGSHEITINFMLKRGDGKFDRSKKYRK
ncbi:MAG: PorP/SprF family type IX secretion system membrane protein [Bacteroidota bacterium]